MDNSNNFSDAEIPSRSYPINKVKNGKRYILVRGDSISFPAHYHYYHYLLGILLPTVMGTQILTDDSDKSVFRQLVIEHIIKSTSGEKNHPVRATNADMYLLSTANDLELLYLNNSLPPAILKRLKSQSDGEMRGVIYEIAIAAAFLRKGYALEWLSGNSQPEFTATNGSSVDVEAKRRNRTGKNDYVLDSEIRAIRQNLKQALSKKRQNPYIIFIDSDLPPNSTNEYQQFYDRCVVEFANLDLEYSALIITNSGYENDKNRIETGRNSAMIFRGKNGPSEDLINAIIISLHAIIPEPFSPDWVID